MRNNELCVRPEVYGRLSAGLGIQSSLVLFTLGVEFSKRLGVPPITDYPNLTCFFKSILKKKKLSVIVTEILSLNIFNLTILSFFFLSVSE